MQRFLFLAALMLVTSPLAAKTIEAKHYRYREHHKALQELWLLRCPWPEAIQLFERHLHASVILDPKVQKQIAGQVIDFHFQDITWEQTLDVLCQANDLRLVTDSATQFHVSRN